MPSIYVSVDDLFTRLKSRLESRFMLTEGKEVEHLIITDSERTFFDEEIARPVLAEALNLIGQSADTRMDEAELKLTITYTEKDRRIENFNYILEDGLLSGFAAEWFKLRGSLDLEAEHRVRFHEKMKEWRHNAAREKVVYTKPVFF